MSVLSPRKTADVRRVYSQWIENDWCQSDTKVATHVTFLGRNTESKWMKDIPELMKLLDLSEDSDCLKTTYVDFVKQEPTTSESASSKAAGKTLTSLRVCVMMEPGNNQEEMEQAYQTACKRGMPVVLLWNTSESALFCCFIRFSLTKKSESNVLFTPDDPYIKDIHDTLDELHSMIVDGKSLKTKIIANTILRMRTTVENKEALKFYQQCGVMECPIWDSLCVSAHDRGLHLLSHLGGTSDPMRWSKSHNSEFTLELNEDATLMLFSGDGSSSGSSSSSFSTNNKCFLLDLREDELDKVRAVRMDEERIESSDEFDHKDELPHQSSSHLPMVVWQYRTKKGNQFMIKTGLDSPDVLFKLPIPFDMGETLGNLFILDRINIPKFKVGKLRYSDLNRMYNIVDFSLLPRLPFVDELSRWSDHFPRDDDGRSIEFVSSLIEEYGQSFDQHYESELHWFDLLKQSGFKNNDQRRKLFKRCLLSAGNAPTKTGMTALKWALKLGDAVMIRAAKACEKSQRSSSNMEESMAEHHSRWSSQSCHFVKEYLIHRRGKEGEKCVRVLRDALVEFIQSRGDFGSVDLMGIVWHSDSESRLLILKRLMMALRTTLDYDTVHKDKTGWMWSKEVVLKHPLWLAEDDRSGDDADETGEKTGDDDGDGGSDSATLIAESKSLALDSASTLAASGWAFTQQVLGFTADPSASFGSSGRLLSASASVSGDRVKAVLGKVKVGGSPLIAKKPKPKKKTAMLMDKSEEGRIFYERITEMVQNEVVTKSGNEIKDAFQKLIEAEPESWMKLCRFQVKNASGIIRQDEIEGGPKPQLSSSEIYAIKLAANQLDFDISKEYDCKAYLTETLTHAHLVNPTFQKLMNEALCGLGVIKFGPVKQPSRVEPKSEEYASEGREWPYTACVIDLVRCSLTVKSLSKVNQACEQLLKYINDMKPGLLSICRCKNGFNKFDGQSGRKSSHMIVPSQYIDVKFNVACKTEDDKKSLSSNMRAIIGEVQILLDCVLKAKQKAHELYEVTRSLPLYKGASMRLDSEYNINQQLLMTGGIERLLVKPITLYPFSFNVKQTTTKSSSKSSILLSNLDFSLLLRANLSNEYLISDLAKAIVDQSNLNALDNILDYMIASFYQFKEGHCCFGKGSGILVQSIILRIAHYKNQQMEEDDLNEFMLDSYKHKIMKGMRENRLHMGLCFNLFIGLDHKIKRKIPWEECLMIKDFKFVPKTLDYLIKIYDGFEKDDTIDSGDRVTGKKYSSSVVSSSRDAKKHLSSMIQPMIEHFTLLSEESKSSDDMLMNDEEDHHHYQLLSFDSSWVPYIIQMRERVALKLLSGNLPIVQKYLGRLGAQSLTQVSDFLTSVDSPNIVKRVFINRETFFYHPVFDGSSYSTGKITLIPHRIQAYLPFNPTLDMSDLWCGKYYINKKWPSNRLLFPEVYLLSERKRSLIIPCIKKFPEFESEDFVLFFGDKRSEQCRTVMVEWSVCELIKQYWMDKKALKVKKEALLGFILRLFPNPEWPYFQAWLQSDEMKLEENKQIRQVLEEQLNDDLIPLVNKSGSLKEYQQWKQARYQKGSSMMMTAADKGDDLYYSLDCLFSVIGDDPNLTRVIIEEYCDSQLSLDQIEIPMLFRADWECKESIDIMVEYLVAMLTAVSTDSTDRSTDASSKSTIVMILSDYLLKQFEEWMVPVHFGVNTGLLLAELFEQYYGKLSTQVKSSDDSSTITTTTPKWIEACIVFLTRFFAQCDRNQLKIVMISDLLLSLPKPLLSHFPVSVVHRMKVSQFVWPPRKNAVSKIVKVCSVIKGFTKEFIADQIAHILVFNVMFWGIFESSILKAVARLFRMLGSDNINRLDLNKAPIDYGFGSFTTSSQILPNWIQFVEEDGTQALLLAALKKMHSSSD